MNSVAKKLLYTAGALAGATALIGLLHLPAARPLLALLEGVPGCPVLDGVAPEKTEAFRRTAMGQRAGELEAASMPAAIFELGQTRAQVETVLHDRGVDCEEARSGSVIRCERLRLPGRSDVTEVHIQFDGKERLVAVDLHQLVRCPANALETMSTLAKEVEDRVGPITATHGEFSDEFLTEHSYRRASHEFRYRKYQARLVALSVPQGIRLRQTYQWVPAS